MFKGRSYLRGFCWRGYVYLLTGEQGARIGLSHNPGLDSAYWLARGYKEFRLLTPPLPLGTAAFLCEYLKRQLKTKNKLKAGQVERLLARAAAKVGLSYFSPGTNSPPDPGLLLPPAELENVRKVLAGRILWLEEAAQALVENRLELSIPLEDMLHYLYLRGEAELLPGVGYDGDGQPRCRRCGQKARVYQVTCEICQTDDCLICENCLVMGQARRCRPLYAIAGRSLPPLSLTAQESTPRLKFDLTAAQADAYREAANFARRRQPGQCLLWAACGAGKTEVAFGAIAVALAQGRNVLYACPRREVIRELYQRFVAAWPQVRIQALYGGSHGKYAPADLYLATTHQALRFYRCFDLVVLDEVDAYPLSGEPMLYYAVERACREKGQTLWLTATPPAEIAARARRGQAGLIYLPARHHGRPLPLPQIIREPRLKWPAAGGLPRCLQATIETVLQQRIQLLIFVPTIELVEAVVAGLKRDWPQPAPGKDWVRGCYAAHPRKEETIAAFQRSEYPVLVTTTVMERGLTIPRLAVLVLYADEERIFSANTLVQIAGRVGRTADYPGGQVFFLARRISPPMVAACRQIKEFNRLARQRGYLKEPVAP